MTVHPDRIPVERWINAGLAVGYAVAILFAAAPAGAKSRAGTVSPTKLASTVEPSSGLPRTVLPRTAIPVRWAANP